VPTPDSSIRKGRNVSTRGSRLALLLVGGIAIVTRLYELGDESFSNDEAFSVAMARLPITEMVSKVRAEDVHPPLYYFILHFFIAFAGENEFSTRFLSVGLSLVFVFAVYVTLARMLDPPSGLLAAVLSAVSVLYIHYGQESRSYTLLLLLTLVASYYAWQTITSDVLSVKVLYPLFAVLLLYTHNAAWLVLAAHNLFFLVYLILTSERTPRRVTTWLTQQGVIGLLYLPWFLVVLEQMKGFPHRSPPSLLEVADLTVNLIDSPAKVLAFAVIATLGILGMMSTMSPRRCPVESMPRRLRVVPAANSSANLLFFSVCATFPIVFAYAWSILGLGARLFTIRALIVTAPAVIALVSWSLAHFVVPSTRVASVILLLVMSLHDIAVYHSKSHRPPTRLLVELINSDARRSDLIVVHAPYFHDTIFTVYNRRRDIPVLVLPPGGKGAWIGQVVHQSDIENLERRLVSYNRVWLLMGRSRDPGGLIKATIEAQFQRRLERRVTDAEIVLYVRNHP